MRDRIATPQRNVWPAVIQLVRRVIAANSTGVVAQAIGVTCPGPIDRATGSMKPFGLPEWHGFPLRRELSEMFGLPVEIDTAGRGLALAEVWIGETSRRSRNDQNVAALVASDEVDGGLIIKGRLAQGTMMNAGQFGHIIVEPEGVECQCGAVGCLSAYVGSRSIQMSTGRDLRRTPPAIVERTGIMLARACASIAAMFDVSDIVVGGVVPLALGPDLFVAVQHELDQRSRLAHLGELRVRGVARLGPLVGAAAVAHDADLIARDGADDESSTGQTRSVWTPKVLTDDADLGARVRIISPDSAPGDGVDNPAG